MTTIVVMPGGFHPFHAGHMSLYNSARRVFPDAEVYVAATNDTSSRPFPFAVKEKLAKLAGVEAGHFVQVSSPFRAAEITSKYNPEQDVLIFVRSEKDAKSQPQPGGVKKDGSPAYLQPLLGAKKLEPFAKHAYMAYLPTVEFGPGMTSATEIRTAWPQLNDKRKQALVMSLYPRTQGNEKLAATVVGLLDAAIGTEQSMSESQEFMSDAQFYGGLLSVLASLGAGLAVSAYMKIKDVVKMYNADQIIKALEGYQVTNISAKERQVLTGLIAQFKQAMSARQGAEALAIAKQIKSISTNRSPVAEGSESSIQKKIQAKQDSLSLAREQRRARGQHQQGPREIKLQAEIDKLNTELTQLKRQGVAEGAPIVVAQAPIDVRNPKKAPQSYRNKGDIVPPTKPPSTEKRGVKGRPGQRPMPKYDEGMAEAAKKCPPATQDITVNLNNRQKAINEYGYGPLNPDLPNTKFWMKKVDEWNLDSMEEAQSSLCGNCAAFDIRQDTLDCIAQGIDSDSPEDAEGVIDAGDLGYCKFLKFKCASRRTCDAWVTGGPLADKPVDENQGWAATYETSAQNFVGGMKAGYQARENQPVGEEKPHDMADPELKQSKRFAKQHYPEFSGDEDLAFDKWVQRSLGHSEQEDAKHAAAIRRLSSKITDLQRQVQQVQSDVAVAPVQEDSDYIEEKWSAKYKSSINCADPKGFSQKAHCAGRKK